ncbi:unnamed protein product [Tilletia controversa]|uniref:Uncharacterized protein n=3 Tax=Tilletia TaxID=13289 RepID=A0A8X7MJH1_9BASI|nr:hypothetical protein CF336_g8654 [Tilletia laevis]KAE8184789.1 hypothetical protein CF328_g7746 [Tilletia controversa]KAE8240862.1 hypothetical protein A4X03_0g8282 [Tilletia caries]KAE8185777.1 hypothetical protein CF335_g7629 [Tilletia laevis]KAE8238274.1 hypothetical protein A4X06_0g8901 [Tilletia controversa]
MHFRILAVFSALLLSPGVFSASASSLQVIADRVGLQQRMVHQVPPAAIESKLSSIAKQATSNFKLDITRFRRLNKLQKKQAKSGKLLDEVKPTFDQVASHFRLAGAQLSNLATTSSGASNTRDARAFVEQRDRRSNTLTPVIQGLTSGFDVLVSQVVDLLKITLDKLDLNVVLDLIEGLASAVLSLKNGLQQLLDIAGNTLGDILDPILQLVGHLLDDLARPRGRRASGTSAPQAA